MKICKLVRELIEILRIIKAGPFHFSDDDIFCENRYPGESGIVGPMHISLVDSWKSSLTNEIVIDGFGNPNVGD